MFRRLRRLDDAVIAWFFPRRLMCCAVPKATVHVHFHGISARSEDDLLRFVHRGLKRMSARGYGGDS